MKKILLGLSALLSVSLTAAIDITGDAKDGTNVFQTGQSGKIAVKGTLTTSDAPVVKYVIFPSKDGTLNSAHDTLTLPTLVLSWEKSKMAFQSSPENIYIKKVIGNTLEDLTANDSYTVHISELVDPAYSSISGLKLTRPGYAFTIPVTSLIKKNELLALAQKAYEKVVGVTDVNVSTYGEVTAVFNGTKKTLRLPLKFGIGKTLTWVGFVLEKDAAFETNKTSMTEEEAKPMLEALKTSVSTSGYIKVTIR